MEAKEKKELTEKIERKVREIIELIDEKAEYGEKCKTCMDSEILGCYQASTAILEMLKKPEKNTSYIVFSNLISTIWTLSHHYNLPMEKIMENAGFVLKQ